MTAAIKTAAGRNRGQKAATGKLPFKIGTTSMVFGRDLIKNVDRLAGVVDHIEIVLFQTMDLHNIPRAEDLGYLRAAGETNNISYSIHLPASLEIASGDKNKRQQSIQTALDIMARMQAIHPLHHILHIPITTPTLTAVPGVYFSRHEGDMPDDWTLRALRALKKLRADSGYGTKLLIENINYSPEFLEPFLNTDLCGLCLDLGHLLLGQENVMDTLTDYLGVIEELHIHGVSGYREHLGLSAIPEESVSRWVRFLMESGYEGIVNLEVFTPADLQESLKIMSALFPANAVTS